MFLKGDPVWVREGDVQSCIAGYIADEFASAAYLRAREDPHATIMVRSIGAGVPLCVRYSELTPRTELPSRS